MPALQRHRDCVAVPVVFREDFQKELTTGRAGLYNGVSLPLALYAHWANFHCNEAHIIAKVSARRESLHLFDDLMTQFKSGQFTVPIHSF